MQVSVARYLRTPPYAARRKGLDFGLVTAYAATATGARLSFAIVLVSPITVADSRDKANPFRRSSILFRPPDPESDPQTKDAPRRFMVEPPGTAPGSDPLITSAFMSIVPKDPSYISEPPYRCKQGFIVRRFIENRSLRRSINVCEDQPQREGHFHASECKRFGERWVVQNDRYKST